MPFQIEDHTRLVSAKGKLYLALKDGKKHQIPAIRKMLAAAGAKRIYGVIYALGRILRANAGKQIIITDRFEKTGTLQMIPYASDKTATKKTAKKVVAKKKAVVKKAKAAKKVSAPAKKAETAELAVA